MWSRRSRSTSTPRPVRLHDRAVPQVLDPDAPRVEQPAERRRLGEPAERCGCGCGDSFERCAVVRAAEVEDVGDRGHPRGSRPACPPRWRCAGPDRPWSARRARVAGSGPATRRPARSGAGRGHGRWPRCAARSCSARAGSWPRCPRSGAWRRTRRVPRRARCRRARGRTARRCRRPSGYADARRLAVGRERSPVEPHRHRGGERGRASGQPVSPRRAERRQPERAGAGLVEGDRRRQRPCARARGPPRPRRTAWSPGWWRAPRGCPTLDLGRAGRTSAPARGRPGR